MLGTTQFQIKVCYSMKGTKFQTVKLCLLCVFDSLVYWQWPSQDSVVELWWWGGVRCTMHAQHGLFSSPSWCLWMLLNVSMLIHMCSSSDSSIKHSCHLALPLMFPPSLYIGSLHSLYCVYLHLCLHLSPVCRWQILGVLSSSWPAKAKF